MNNGKYDFVILGGGFTGLYLSYLLMKQGYEVAILEKSTSPGGFLKTVKYKDYKFDLGGHRLVFKDDSDLFGFLKDIGLEDEILKLEKKSKIFIFDDLINYPPTLKDAFLFPKQQLKGIILDFLIKRYKFYKTDSLEDWLRFHYGETIYNLVFRDYSRKVWGMECSDLPAHWLDKRIGKFKIINFLLGISCINSKDTRRRFYYPGLGIGMIIDALLERIRSRVDVISGAEITEIFDDNRKLNKIGFTLDGSESKTLSFDKIISTIPNIELIRYLPTESFDKYLDYFQYRNIIFLNILLKSPNPVTASHWTYLPSQNTIFSRIYEPQIWSKAMVSSKGNSLSLEVICGDKMFDISEHTLFNAGRDVLNSLGMEDVKEMADDYFISKHKYAYPVLTNIGYLERAKQNIMARYPGLYLAGRMGSHSYYDIEDCIEDANRLVERIRG